MGAVSMARTIGGCTNYFEWMRSGPIRPFFKKERTVEDKPPPMSPEETELLHLLMDEAKTRRSAESDLLNTNFMSAPLPDEQRRRIDDLGADYVSSRTSAVDEAVDMADKKLRQRFATQGILDSSIASNEYTNLQDKRIKALDTITKEADLFKYGAEDDYRKSLLSEQLQKIGVLNPNTAGMLYGGLSSARSQEAARKLQLALYNSQQKGFWEEFLPGAMATAGSVIGGIYGGPAGAAAGGAAGQSSGEALGSLERL